MSTQATSGAMGTSNRYVKYTITITQNSQSIAGNTSNVTVSVRFYRTNTGYETWGTGTVYCKINGTTYSAGVTPSQKITNGGIVLFTKTMNIAHNSDGTKTLTCSAWIQHDAPLTSSEQSYSQTLTTIPRTSSIGSINGNTLGSCVTVNISRASNSFTHKVIYQRTDGNKYTVGTNIGTSCTFTMDLGDCNYLPNSTSGTAKIIVNTYSGSTYIGETSKSFTVYVPSSVVPTVSTSISDPTGYSSTYGGYIQSLSKIAISTSASGSYSSTIRSYKTTADGKTYTSASVTSGVISGSGNLAINTTVTDSRGRTASVGRTISVMPYQQPKITEMTVSRCNANGTNSSSGAYLAVRFNASATSLNSKNTVVYSVKYKRTTDSYYTEATLDGYANSYFVSDGVYIFAADTWSSYNVILTVEDSFNSASKTADGGTANKLFSFLRRGLGVAFGKVAEFEDTVEFAFKTLFQKAAMFKGTATFDGSATFNNKAKFWGVVEFTAESQHKSPVVFENDNRIYGTKTDGTIFEAMITCAPNNNTALGYGNYEKKSGNTEIWGYDIQFGVSNTARSATYRPYYRRGDKITYNAIATAGYLTAGGTQVSFTLPIPKPIIGSPAITASAINGFILRQGSKYTHGSSSGSSVHPDRYSVNYNGGVFIRIDAHFNNSTNATNNDAIGISWSGEITLS